jgi:membrane protein insertase Oxa1/YidC/SpoIIIJ
VLVQIPVLIAIFAVLGEFSEASGQSFLWIGDLSSPDTIGKLPMAVPGFGKELSLLPIILGLVTAASPLTQHYDDTSERRRALRSAALLGFVFALLFYPFPSQLVLYWTSANGIQALLPLIVSRLTYSRPEAPTDVG